MKGCEWVVFSVHADACSHVCDRLWVVSNVVTKQKYTESSMRSIVLARLNSIARTLDLETDVRNVIDENGQVRWPVPPPSPLPVSNNKYSVKSFGTVTH